MSRGQDSTFFVAFLTALIVSIGTTLVMYIFVLPRIPMPQMQAAGRVTSPRVRRWRFRPLWGCL